MKTTLKVLGSVFALGLVILLVFHLVMLHGLTRAMRDVVLPRIKEESGIDARVGRLSINVAGGELILNDVEIRNPEGFLLENLASAERVLVEVDFVSLISKKPIHARNVELDHVLVNVIRNKDGDINLNKLQEGLPMPPSGEPGKKPVPGEGGTPTERLPEPGKPAPGPAESKPLPEMLFDAIVCKATVRYLDFRLNELDIALDLDAKAQGLSTLQDPATPWGHVSIAGSLGDDRTSFITDLKLRIAPLVDLENPSFDLTGKIMEIDPRIMQEIYDDMGIRSAPFGLDPRFQCRNGWFEESSIGFNLRDIELEDKLSKRLGGMGTIGSLKLVVPVQGSLQEPTMDFERALTSAIGGNAISILDAFLKGAVSTETGMQEPPEKMTDAVVEVLGAHVEEIGESETVKKVLKDLADGEPSATNAPSPVSIDTLVDLLGEEVKEIGEDEELKNDLKQLGGWLFGK
ncbi:AsmA family protein [Pontiella desulfatans]|nr:hypothetical protein [Pontiella desulfatans]